jgi:hypothetical protein
MKTFKRIRTENFRFRLKSQLFLDPLVILQLQEKIYRNTGFAREVWEDEDVVWRDATLEDLTSMSLQKLINPRDDDHMPICFKPIGGLFGWSLSLQIYDGAYDGTWRPARVQDLSIKDGKIQGGLGLVRRG